MKELLHLAHYKLNNNDDDDDKLNKNSDNDDKNIYTYNDDDTECTENITNASFDSYNDNYNEEFVFTTTKKTLLSIKRDPNKYGNSTPWNQQP